MTETAITTVDQLYAATAAAQPGDVLILTPGEYVTDARLELAANGTADAPITLTGPPGRGHPHQARRRV